MKEQINRYARGTFEYEPLSAVTEPEMIIAAVKKNCEQSEGSPGHTGAEKSSDTGYAGSVKISERIGREIKGLLFSTNKRVRLSTDRFIGMENTVGYLVDVPLPIRRQPQAGTLCCRGSLSNTNVSAWAKC